MRHEQLQQAIVQEAAESAWGFEKGEGVARWRRVEHDEVITPRIQKSMQGFHSSVFLHPGDHLGDLLINGIAEKSLHIRGVGDEPPNSLICYQLRIEHPGLEGARGRDSSALSDRFRDAERLRCVSCNAEGLGEATGGIYGEDEDAAAAPGGG